MALVSFKDLCLDVVDTAVMAPFWAAALGHGPGRVPHDALGRVLRHTT